MITVGPSWLDRLTRFAPRLFQPTLQPAHPSAALNLEPASEQCASSNAIDITPGITATNAVGDPHQLDLSLSAIDPGVVSSHRPEDRLTITRTGDSTTLDDASGGKLIGRAA